MANRNIHIFSSIIGRGNPRDITIPVARFPTFWSCACDNIKIGFNFSQIPFLWNFPNPLNPAVLHRPHLSTAFRVSRSASSLAMISLRMSLLLRGGVYL